MSAGTQPSGRRIELVGGDFLSVARTWIWGFRPPDPPLRGGTPPLKLSYLDSLSSRFFIRGFPPNKNAAKPSGNKGVRESLRMDGWCEAWCGVRSILDFSWKLLTQAVRNRSSGCKVRLS